MSNQTNQQVNLHEEALSSSLQMPGDQEQGIEFNLEANNY